ncbi:MAG: hypothetical protein SYC29_00840 [Planctomycetota bacterium]|nr:hypothetical protein [Planctomycetota bacterium]
MATHSPNTPPFEAEPQTSDIVLRMSRALDALEDVIAREAELNAVESVTAYDASLRIQEFAFERMEAALRAVIDSEPVSRGDAILRHLARLTYAAISVDPGTGLRAPADAVAHFVGECGGLDLPHRGLLDRADVQVGLYTQAFGQMDIWDEELFAAPIS